MNITYFRVFLGILGHYSIQYLNFAKKLFNSVFNLKFWRKFNSKKYSIKKFARKFNSKKYSIKKIQFKKIFNSKICKKIQFKIWFKMLNLAGFNSTIYSFNNKTWVSLTPTRWWLEHFHQCGRLCWPRVCLEGWIPAQERRRGLSLHEWWRRIWWLWMW